MKRGFFIALFFVLLSCHAFSAGLDTGTATYGTRVRLNTDNFDGALSSTDTTVQKALDTLDDSSSSFDGDLTGDLSVSGTSTLTGAVTMASDLDVDGHVYVGTGTPSTIDGGSGDLYVSDDLEVAGDVEIDGNIYVDGVLYVDEIQSTSVADANVEIDGIFNVVSTPDATGTHTTGPGSLYVQDTLEIDGVVYLGSAIIKDSSGNVGINKNSPDASLTIGQLNDTAGVKVCGYDDMSSICIKNYVNQYGVSMIEAPTDFRILSTGALRFLISNGAKTHCMRQSTGYFGLLTESPAALLDIGAGSKTHIDGTDDVLVKDDVEVDGVIYNDGIHVISGNTVCWDSTSHEFYVNTTCP